MREISIPSKLFSFLLFGFLLFGLSYFATSNVNAANFTVPGDFATIKEAVNDASVMDGDKIIVSAGTFNETNIVIKKELNITGAGKGVTIIDAGGLQGLRISADNVTIHDLTVQNAKLAIRFAAAGITFDNPDIRRVELLNNNIGIVVGGSSTVTNIVVRECDFINNGKGFRVNKRAHLDGGLIRDSTFDSNSVGVHFFNNDNVSTVSNVKILFNTFSNHTVGRAAAIYMEEAQNTRIQNNLFMDNFNDVVISKLYQPAIPVSEIRVSRNTIMGTTGFVFTIFNADNGGQTVFNNVLFALNDISTADATVVYAGAHRTGLPSMGGTGWNTVRVKRNCITGTTSAGKGVRYFVPDGLDPNQALGGAILNARNNFWGVGTLAGVTALMENPAITDFSTFQTSCDM